MNFFLYWLVFAVIVLLAEKQLTYTEFSILIVLLLVSIISFAVIKYVSAKRDKRFKIGDKLTVVYSSTRTKSKGVVLNMDWAYVTMRSDDGNVQIHMPRSEMKKATIENHSRGVIFVGT